MKLLVAVIVCCVRLSVAFQHSSLCLSFVLNIRRFYSHLGYFVGLFSFRLIFNSYATICPPLQGDNPRVLASRLSPLQADKPPVREIFYSLKLVDYLLVEADKPCLLLRDDPRGLASELSPVQGGGGGQNVVRILLSMKYFVLKFAISGKGGVKFITHNYTDKRDALLHRIGLPSNTSTP